MAPAMVRTLQAEVEEARTALDRLADVLDPNQVVLDEWATPDQVVDYAIAVIRDLAGRAGGAR